MNSHEPVTLGAAALTALQVQTIADGALVEVDAKAIMAMTITRRILEKAAHENQPVYGVTTGLGPKVVEPLPNADIDDFSINTIRARHNAVGDPLPATWVRAGMAVRLNTLLSGVAGSRTQLAEHIALCLNRQITPLIPESGTIGVADLCWGGAFGSAMIGEGTVLMPDGTAQSAAQAMKAAGVPAYRPQLREGLALVSHSCFTAGISAIAWNRLTRCYQAAQVAAALSMEGFRANVSPLDKRVLTLRPQQGQLQSAGELLKLLEGSSLLRAGAARRLQDPLSIRNVAQVHGSTAAMLNQLQQAVTDEINGASDNPAVIAADEAILSHGGYLPVYLGITLSSTLQSFVHLAALQVSRISKLLFKRFSGLANGLTTAGANGAGLAPAMKTAEALFAQIAHLATPPPVYPGMSADGLEDIVTHAAIPATTAFTIADKLDRLSAIEMLVAIQAIDLRDIHQTLSPSLQSTYALLRDAVPLVDADRALGPDIEAIYALIEQGKATF